MRISDWSSDVCSSDLPGYVKLVDQPKRLFCIEFRHAYDGIAAMESANGEPERGVMVQRPRVQDCLVLRPVQERREGVDTAELMVDDALGALGRNAGCHGLPIWSDDSLTRLVAAFA